MLFLYSYSLEMPSSGAFEAYVYRIGVAHAGSQESGSRGLVSDSGFTWLRHKIRLYPSLLSTDIIFFVSEEDMIIKPLTLWSLTGKYAIEIYQAFSDFFKTCFAEYNLEANSPWNLLFTLIPHRVPTNVSYCSLSEGTVCCNYSIIVLLMYTLLNSCCSLDWFIF